jgi:hypothetical protein
MATAEGTNFERLKKAGLVVKEPLPDEHQAVIDALTGDEIDIIESITARLLAADRLEGLEPAEPGKPGFANCVIF